MCWHLGAQGGVALSVKEQRMQRSAAYDEHTSSVGFSGRRSCERPGLPCGPGREQPSVLPTGTSVLRGIACPPRGTLAAAASRPGWQHQCTWTRSR